METIMIYEGSTIDNIPYFEVGDFGQTITFHIIQQNGAAVDLTDKVIVFKAKKINNFDEYLIVGSNCVVTDAVSGYCTYTFADGQLSEEGSFFAGLEITESGVDHNSISLGYLNINEDN